MKEIPFELVSKYSPQGDQPQAIAKLAQGIYQNKKFQTLLGATGTGKTYTGLGAVTQLYKDLNGKLAVIIVCPYQNQLDLL